MARARNIKPSLFMNETLGTLDPLITLLFQGLWCLADREGRLEDRPLRIKAEIFPYRESLDINGYLTVLEQKGFIWRFEAMGERYIQVIKFLKHQSPHSTEKPSVIPKPPEELTNKTYTCTFNHTLTVIPPLNNDRFTQALPPDSLIPDSLIPDSLNLPNPNGLGCIPSVEGTTPLDKKKEKVHNPKDDPPTPPVDPPTPPEKPKGVDLCPYDDIVNLYHKILPELPSVQKLTDARKTQIRRRWEKDLTTIDQWKNYFKFIRSSDFLMGRTPPKGERTIFKANLEWLTTLRNFVNTSEDKYH